MVAVQGALRVYFIQRVGGEDQVIRSFLSRGDLCDV